MIGLSFQDDRPVNGQKQPNKRPFWETKSAVERTRQLEKQRNLFVVMHLGSLVVLNQLDACF